MKYIKLFLLSIILLFTFIINCYADDTKLISSKDKRIFDYADLLSKSEEKKLNKKIKTFKETSKMDAVIITTKDLDNMNISSYAEEFYKKNSFTKNSVIYVVYINDLEPEIYMYCTGNKATKYYTNERIGEILQYDYDYIEKKDYYNAFDKFMVIIQVFFDKENQSDNYYLDKDGKITKIIPWVEIVVLAIALTFIVVVLLIYKINNNNKIKRSSILDDRLNKDSVVIETLKDEAIATNISK